MKIAILGAGAWGSALAINLSHHQINLWTRDAQHAAEMVATRINRRYLPQYVLPETIRVTSILAEAIEQVDFVLILVPISGLRETLKKSLQHESNCHCCGGVRDLNPIRRYCRTKSCNRNVLICHYVRACCLDPASQTKLRETCRLR